MNIVPRSLFVVCCLVGQTCATWTFGLNNPNYVTISQKSGQILPLQKTTRVRLEEPPCFILKFVHVTVNNMISTPAVTFDKQTLTVTISYALLASSTSSYEVTGKGIRLRDCNGGNRVRNFQSGKSKGATSNTKMKANSNYQYNVGQNGESGGGGHAGGNVLGGIGGYAGDGYHEGAGGNAGSGGGHVGGGGYTGNGNHGGGSGHAGYDGHEGAGGHTFDGGYSGYGDHGGNSGGHAGSGGHEGNGGAHGGGGGYVGNNNGGSGGHSESSFEIYIDDHYDMTNWQGTNNDYYDTDNGIHINEHADGTGKYSPNIIDSNEYGWGSYQFLVGGKGGKKGSPRGKYSTAGKGQSLKLIMGKGDKGTSDKRLAGSYYGGGSGFGGGSAYGDVGGNGNSGDSGNHSNSGPQRWATTIHYRQALNQTWR